ncbi:MAG: GlsB/YeaQ/YmgE family stress response membrane protein [Pseudomonadota bacterium]
MSFIIWIVIGGIAGYIAEKVTKSDHSLLTNIIVGIIGSFIGGYLARILNLKLAGGFVDQLIVATAGAIILVYVYKQIKK